MRDRVTVTTAPLYAVQHRETAPLLPAVVLFLIMLAALVAWFWAAWRNMKGYKLAQFGVHSINQLLTRLLWRARVRGSLQLAPDQGALVVCNHRSSVDPMLLQLITKRIMFWMVAREYVVQPALAWLFGIVPNIPVNRGGIDTAATRLAIRLAAEGQIVAQFPEGRINTTENLLLPGRPGAALIALHARVPVVPCYIDGAPIGKTVASPLVKPGRATIYVGKPIDISEYFGREKEKEVLDMLTLRLLKAIARLGGRGDFQPTVTGRGARIEVEVEAPSV